MRSGYQMITPEEQKPKILQVNLQLTGEISLEFDFSSSLIL